MISIINVFSLSHTVVRGLLLLSIRLTSEDGVRVSAMKNMTSASFSLRTQQQPGKNMIQATQIITEGYHILKCHTSVRQSSKALRTLHLPSHALRLDIESSVDEK